MDMSMFSLPSSRKRRVELAHAAARDDTDGEASAHEEEVSTPESGGTSHEPAAGVPRWAQWGLFVAALAVLVTGVLAWQGAGSDDADRAETRDRALIEGRRLVETMQTMDPRDLESHLDRWREATTGVLRDQLDNVSDDDRQVLLDQDKHSTARVVDAALTSLDDDGAVMIAAVEVTTREIDDADSEPPGP